MDMEQVKTPETKKVYVKPTIEFISLDDSEMAMFREAVAMHEDLSEDQMLTIKELLNRKRQS